MITNEEIARINELAHKSKTPEGLTVAEKEEQAKLRQKFLASVRANLKAQLDNIDIVDENGNVENLGEKYSKGK